MTRAVPERTRLTLGYIALTDAAPLIVAAERGCFSEQGLDVTLSREQSWASVRDKVATGVLDAAQMLAPMPLAMTAGVSGVRCEMIVPMSLGLGGNAITFSTALHHAIKAFSPDAEGFPLSAEVLRPIVVQRRLQGLTSLTFGIVFPFSSHHYELRTWLKAGGIDPDRDVHLVVIPPAQMVRRLEAGEIDGFCVGEPWNSLAVDRGIGRAMVTKHDIWQNSPEKVFVVTRQWALNHPATLAALLRALLTAAAWIDEPEHRAEVAELLARPTYLDAPVDVVGRSLAGKFLFDATRVPRVLPDFHVFFRYAATFPWVSHAEWFLNQMRQWRQLPERTDCSALAAAVYRPDLYRASAASLQIPFPLDDRKPEGEHATAWTLGRATSPILMGPDRLVDGAAARP